MAGDNRLIEIMAGLLAEVRDIKIDLRSFKNESAIRLERLEQQQAKRNLALGKLRLLVMSLTDRIEQLMHLDQRVRVSEELMLSPGPRKVA